MPLRWIRGSSEVATTGSTPALVASGWPGDAAGVLLVHGDDQAAGVAVLGAQLLELGVGAPQHVREPLALQREGRAQALAGEAALAERVVEARGVALAVRTSATAISPFTRGKKTGRTTLGVVQRLAVAVLVVGLRLVAGVADEGDAWSRRSGRGSRRSRAGGWRGWRPCWIESPQAWLSAAWWTSSRMPMARWAMRAIACGAAAACW